jgi:NAD(P)-dependent dehydrogenase (short-subunit alcohol dehydrogenase family)
MAVRDPSRGEEAAESVRADAPDAAIEVMKLDLAELSSIREFAAAFAGRYERLDLLVNNAGVMMPPASKTADGFELQFGTNHLGHFALTGLLLGLLLDTPGSRIVSVSSQAHRWGSMDFDDLQWESRPYKEAASYGQSKLANLLFTHELQRRLEAAGADTVAVAAHPGWTATNLQRNNRLFRALNPLLAMKPWQGALPTLFAATADDVEGGAYYGPKGLYEMRGYPGRATTSDEARDEGVARRLWEVSSTLTGVDFDRLPASA